MDWLRFYSFIHSCTEWDEAAVSACIDALEVLGGGSQVAHAVCCLPTENLRDQLIVKAVRHKVSFTRADLAVIDGQVRGEVFTSLLISQNLDPWDWKTDEDNLTWEMFDEGYFRWHKTDLLRRIGKLKTIGSADDVSAAVWSIHDPECKEALYQKALSMGVKFSRSNLRSMGKAGEDTLHEESPELQAFTDSVTRLTQRLNDLCDELEEKQTPPKPKRRKKGGGFWASLFGVLAAGAVKRKNARRCNGDCANCPPHYGYRHGRWYYGHGHMHGCERGGNGGASGRTLRN